MKPYPDRREHLRGYMEDAAARYLNELEESGMQLTQEQTEEVAEHAIEEANKDYMRQWNEVFQHNIPVLELRHKEQMNKIKRESARRRLFVLLPVALAFLALAVYSIVQYASIVECGLYIVGALVFLAMLSDRTAK